MRKAIWITGVPAAGKSALGERLVTAMRREFSSPCAIVDANVIRNQFWPHLGLSPEDRIVNVNGMAELAGVFIRAGNDVVVACIAPDRAVRNRALGLIRVSAQAVSVHQVHVFAPLAVLEARDKKGLYAAHGQGTLTGLTGIDAPYEPPTPDEALYLDTSKLTLGDCVQEVLRYVRDTPPKTWMQGEAGRPKA
jgi:adenylylsulfate kinase-like enzyme